MIEQLKEISKKTYYNVHDKNKNPLRILGFDISGSEIIAQFIPNQSTCLLNCILTNDKIGLINFKYLKELDINN